MRMKLLFRRTFIARHLIEEAPAFYGFELRQLFRKLKSLFYW